jgi:AcrR family transcriptional regulator
MGRPRLDDVRRPQILDAFARCVARYGIAGSTLERVAAEAGVTRALVRHYLGNRDEVEAALTRHMVQRDEDDFDARLKGAPQGGRLGTVLDLAFGDGREANAVVMDELLSVAGRLPEIRKMLRAHYRRIQRLLDRELAAAYPKADPRQRNAVAYGVLCIAGMDDSMRELGLQEARAGQGRRAADRLLSTLGRRG